MKLLKEILAWLGSICIGILSALLISIFIFQPTKVLGSSMEPTLQNNHRIYVSKLPRAIDYKPHYGDIVIIDSRVNRTRTWMDDILDSPLYRWIADDKEHHVWVKRVIGKPGDVIQFKQNRIYRNGELLQEDYILEAMRNIIDQKITVPEGSIFVMGDNRNHSQDSREIGSVPIHHVLGVKLF